MDNTQTGQMFGQIVENRGDHFAVLCSDNIKRMGKLSGAAKRGQRLLTGSFVVLSVREYETEQKNCDIISAGNPPQDVINIFRKINPIAGDDSNIKFYTQDDKFKDLEDLSSLRKNIVIKPLSELPIDKNSKVNDVFEDNGDEIYKDPTIHQEEINWDFL